MKFSELYRKLEKDGWYIVRTTKHHIYVHPVKPGAIAVGKHARGSNRNIKQDSQRNWT